MVVQRSVDVAWFFHRFECTASQGFFVSGANFLFVVRVLCGFIRGVLGFVE